MKTNINKLMELYGMQSHTAKKVAQLLECRLPKNYTTIIQSRAKDKGIIVSKQRIRIIKCLSRADINVLNIIIEYIKEINANAVAGSKKLNELIN